MNIGKVIGRVVSTVRYKGLKGVKFLIVQPVDEQSKPIGQAIVACDAVQAGIGELVFFVGGREASMACPVPFVPVDATIIGHVEQLALESEGNQ